ncbi:6862_t:CDS:1 [Scutellospora calospora]|uniref:6862_t:CDS:1 n=1 Tax=Scutellospora calospora TaxID=85575 RepID=A0ACA9MSZ4_9GLOM|nr:6862_t:CDS:1 [Scutellospora calospora]
MNVNDSNIGNAENYSNIGNVEKATNHTIINKADLKYLEFEALYNAYIRKHNNIVAKLLDPFVQYNLSELPKVVVVQPDMKTGYGNRLPGIVCGFLYSLLSDRLFFIDGYKNFETYYEKDFNHDWQIVANLYENSTYRYIHNTNSYNDFRLVTRGNFNNEEINLQKILYIHTWDYICAPITSNPHYKEWFDKIIPDYRVFKTISLKLLRVHPNIRKQIDTFADKNFNEYNIGIHLREIKSLANSIQPIEHYSQAVKMLLLGRKKTNISIFVAADNNIGRKQIVKSLRKEFNSNSDNSIKIIYTKDNMNLANPVSRNPGSEVGALIDMQLLSLCDDLVITYGSSFGFIAAGWSNKTSHHRGPFVIMPITDSRDDLWILDKVWVWGAVSNEPCMYSSKLLIINEDEETVEIFKTNPLWMHYSQCHWPI